MEELESKDIGQQSGYLRGYRSWMELVRWSWMWVITINVELAVSAYLIEVHHFDGNQFCPFRNWWGVLCPSQLMEFFTILTTFLNCHHFQEVIPLLIDILDNLCCTFLPFKSQMFISQAFGAWLIMKARCKCLKWLWNVCNSFCLICELY